MVLNTGDSANNILASYPGPSHKVGRGPGTHCLRMRNVFRFPLCKKHPTHTLLTWDVPRPLPQSGFVRRGLNIIVASCPGPSHIVALWEGLNTRLNFIADGFTKPVGSHRETSLPSYTRRTACSCSGLSTIPAFPTFCSAYTQLRQPAHHLKKTSSRTINFVTRMYMVSIRT